MFVPQAGQVVAQRYELVREIGRGGMGCVWQAIDRELEAPCALKFILEHFAQRSELRTRFMREARAVANLHSPYVVSIRGVGEHGNALYIAMELLHGETLERRLGREGALAPRDVVTVVSQIASVLTTAHAAGIVHRDLKPENIWLWAESDVFVKLLDFGVAKHVLAEKTGLKTATGTLVGTPHYMSPEQAAGDRSVDHRSDIWSLAVIAVECLSGRRPFDSDGLGQLLLQIMQGPIPPLRDLYPQAPPTLEGWWQQAMQRDVEQRFQSATALAASLAAALDGSDLLGVSSEPSARALATERRSAANSEKTEPMLGPPLAQPRAPARTTGPHAPQHEPGAEPRGDAADTVEPPSRTHSPSATARVPLNRTPWLAIAAGAGLLVSGALWFLMSGGAQDAAVRPRPPVAASSSPPRSDLPPVSPPRESEPAAVRRPSPRAVTSSATPTPPEPQPAAPPSPRSGASPTTSTAKAAEDSSPSSAPPQRPAPRAVSPNALSPSPRPAPKPAPRAVDSRVGF